MDNDFLEKIQVCVAYDLIGSGTMVSYEDMSSVNKIRFTKQSTRLYHACMMSPTDREYIYERYDEITGRLSVKNELVNIYT